MPASRLLPAEQRSTLPPAPTTSRWWRTHVLLRSWLNRHRHRWLAPLLVCAPPVGVAMVWAGATRPGHARRWLTAAALVWSLVVVLGVGLIALPGASPADAGGAPPPAAGGPALTAPAPSPSTTRDDAAAVAAVRGAPVRGAGVGAAAVDADARVETPAGAATTPVPAGAPAPDSSAVPAAPAGGVPTSAAPTARPRPPKATPTPTPAPTPHRTTPAPPTPPAIPTANPFTTCSTEGAQAVSPNGFPLRCLRTPIGLYWLWSR